MGVSFWKWGADERVDASGVGVNDPSRRIPFACADFAFIREIAIWLPWGFMIGSLPGLKPG
jgi:hypothetical protein